MAQRLRELARAEIAEQNERTELDAVVASLKSRFPALSVEAGGCLVGASASSIAMSAEKALIVLSHLADNAVRHNAKTIRLEAAREDGMIRMTVSNDGDPISATNRERIFDAFFTTRREQGGTGMGLAIVRAIMTSHGGAIRLLPGDDGAAFELWFPAA
jgi:signal transduction histidine kinase